MPPFIVALLILSSVAGGLSALYLLYVFNEFVSKRRGVRGDLSEKIKVVERAASDKEKAPLSKPLEEVFKSFTFRQYAFNENVREAVNNLLKEIAKRRSERAEGAKESEENAPSAEFDVVDKYVLEKIANELSEKSFPSPHLLSEDESPEPPRPAEPLSEKTYELMSQLHSEVEERLHELARQRGVDSKDAIFQMLFLRNLHRAQVIGGQLYAFLRAAWNVMRAAGFEYGRGFVSETEGQLTVRLLEVSRALILKRETAADSATAGESERQGQIDNTSAKSEEGSTEE